ncbi:choice-of-anchor tandem repeat NxxGxxAF-containing protein [Methylococcus sp. EFPC2]|uniref:DUF7453 family protein n=1 Tax=Methylococcus sp. EFPC2 TaxID=2812648 RepID=UPI001966D634|nr:choice-of-anchor tandem repeat NxxGxxAF-containing protein [Methylococcus sp. EFPC2]QSA95626.1 hypothetical protein JWZ97_10205 [Methylococcus sp. EFPC2]
MINQCLAIAPNAISRSHMLSLLSRVCAAAFLFAAGASLASAEPAGKHEFEFINVADSTQGFTNFEPFPAINNKSAVAFVATRSDTGQGVFRSRGGKVTTIASEQDGLESFDIAPAINARGVVAFSSRTSSGSSAIFTGDGRSRKLIADSKTNGLFRIGMGSPAINDAGTVAFSSVLSENGRPAGASIFTGKGGDLSTVLNTSASDFVSFGNVAINDAEKIVFSGERSDGSLGIFTVRRAPKTIVDTHARPEFIGFGDPVINNGGTIADVAFLIADGLNNGLEIISGKAGAIVSRTDPSGPAFANAEHPSINNHGAVAFYAFPNLDPNEPTGIFLEVSGGNSLIPVIRPGDALFGSTVSAVDLGRFALNDRFEAVFQYALTDGRTGIAIAAFHGEKEDDQAK